MTVHRTVRPCYGVAHREPSEIAAEIEYALKTATTTPVGVIEATEALAESVLATRQFDVARFQALLQAADMTFDQLFKQYVGKNVLNFFRQDHGYKDGSYRKHWHDGREDNEHLVEAVQSLDTTKPEFKDELYQALVARYSI